MTLSTLSEEWRNTAFVRDLFANRIEWSSHKLKTSWLWESSISIALKWNMISNFFKFLEKKKILIRMKFYFIVFAVESWLTNLMPDEEVKNSI